MKSIKGLLWAATMIIATSQMSYGQFSVGIRETRYPWIQYTWSNSFSARIEQSVYAEKLRFQYVRLYLGYRHQINQLTLRVEPYFGSTYSNLYFSTGGSLGADLQLHRIVSVTGEFVPHYDSQMGYKTCYLGSVKCDITKSLGVVGTFSNIPEYRMPEQRLKVGLLFHVGSLIVLPEISFPLNNREGRNLKMLVSMSYIF